MWRRYLLGNPVFLSRVVAQARGRRPTRPGLARRARQRAGAARAASSRSPTSPRTRSTWRSARASSAPTPSGGLAGGVAAVSCSGRRASGSTRLLLPDALRRHELLWVLPVGACAVGAGADGARVRARARSRSRSACIALAAAVAISPAPIGAGSPRSRPAADAAAGAPAGSPARLAAWAGLTWRCCWCSIALIPLFRAGFVTVSGTGRTRTWPSARRSSCSTHSADRGRRRRAGRPGAAGLALQAADLLRARRRGHAVRAARCSRRISVVAAVMLALAASGWFLVARELLGRRRLRGAGAMAARRAWTGWSSTPACTRTSTRPGATSRCRSRSCWAGRAIEQRTRGGLALLALFLLAVRVRVPAGAADPARSCSRLVAGPAGAAPGGRRRSRPVAGWRRALPRPALAAVARAAGGRAAHPDRRRAREGRSPPTASSTPTRRCRPGAATCRVLPGRGVLRLSFHDGWPLRRARARRLRRLRALRACRGRSAWGLGAVLLFGALFAMYFRLRKYGWYFHFKVLAFTVPLAMTAAVVGIASCGRSAVGRHWRWVGRRAVVLLAAW